jgi:hypothetical protein
MSTPAWILEIFAAVMLLVAEVSAGQLVIARAWTRRGGTDADITVSHLLMGIALAGIFVPGVSTLPNAVWEVVFAVMTAWFGWCLWRESRGRGAAAMARGHYAPHLVHSAAMLYLFAALAGPSVEGSGMSMTGTGGMSGMAGGSPEGTATLHAPTLALIFALLLIAFTIHDLDRQAGKDGYFHVVGRRSVPAGSTLAGAAAGPVALSQPTQSDAAETVPRADPGAYTAEPLLLSPAVVKGCQVAIGATMAFILIIMILVRHQHFLILYFGIVRYAMAGGLVFTLLVVIGSPRPFDSSRSLDSGDERDTAQPALTEPSAAAEPPRAAGRGGRNVRCDAHGMQHE